MHADVQQGKPSLGAMGKAWGVVRLKMGGCSRFPGRKTTIVLSENSGRRERSTNILNLHKKKIALILPPPNVIWTSVSLLAIALRPSTHTHHLSVHVDGYP